MAVAAPARTRDASAAVRRLPGRIASRLVQLVIVVLFVVILTTTMINLLPGDPARTILGPRGTPEGVAALNAELGTDKPVWGQVLDLVTGVFRADLGDSIARPGESVLGLVLPALEVTVAILGLSVLLSILLGVPLGILAALGHRRGRGAAARMDGFIRVLAIVFFAIPPALLALILILVASLQLRLLPVGGWGTGWPGNLEFALLPAVTVMAFFVPLIVRSSRQAAIETLREPFVEGLYSRGVSQRRIVFRHVIPNSALPVITVLGVNAGLMIGGVAVVEAVFATPGLGTSIAEAVAARDYPWVRGVVLVTAVMVVTLNMIIDVVYGLIDPRVRLGRR